MVWKTIKAVYGYVIDVSDCLDEDGYIEHDKLREKPNMDSQENLLMHGRLTIK